MRCFSFLDLSTSQIKLIVSSFILLISAFKIINTLYNLQFLGNLYLDYFKYQKTGVDTNAFLLDPIKHCFYF